MSAGSLVHPGVTLLSVVPLKVTSLCHLREFFPLPLCFNILPFSFLYVTKATYGLHANQNRFQVFVCNVRKFYHVHV